MGHVVLQVSTIVCEAIDMCTGDTGCDQCNSQEPIDIVLVVDFNVTLSKSVGCSGLDFTTLKNSINGQIALGGVLVKQAGGNLVSCAQLSTNCTEMVWPLHNCTGYGIMNCVGWNNY